MARIRSVHPGMASDEAYMQMSMAAKAAWPLLWTECDDQGIFEWKPIVLKARIFPADNVDFTAILDEYAELGCIRMAEVEGKAFGFVRNFCRYQRPKNPSHRYCLPPEQERYVGKKDIEGVSPTPGLPQETPRPTEKPLQRKEEGGRMEEEGSPSDKSSGAHASAEAPAPRQPVDDESEIGGRVVQLVPPAEKRKAAKRPEVPWPQDLDLCDELRAFAEERGFLGDAVRRLWEAFEANAKAKALRYVDWRHAWRTWVLKQLEFDAKSRRPMYATGNRPRGRPPDV